MFATTRSLTITLVAPGSPFAPVAPVAPAAPVAPVSPLSPLAPAGSCPALKSTARSERFFTFADVTALLPMSDGLHRAGGDLGRSNRVRGQGDAGIGAAG